MTLLSSFCATHRPTPVALTILSALMENVCPPIESWTSAPSRSHRAHTDVVRCNRAD